MRKLPPSPMLEPCRKVARLCSSDRVAPRQNCFRTAKATTILLVLIMWRFPAHADIFVDIFYPAPRFQFEGGSYEASPYDWFVLKKAAPTPYSFSSFNIDYTVPIQCDEIAKQAERVEAFSAAVRSSVAASEAAIKVNDRETVTSANLQSSDSLRRMKAANGFLEVMNSRPIKGPLLVQRSAIDPLEPFLMWAATVGVEDSSWVKDLQLMSIDSALPVEFRRMQDRGYGSRRAWTTGKFEVTNTPALSSWASSVGRTGTDYPLTVTDNIKGWLDVTLNLTQGQYCSALREQRGEILSFEVSHSSPVFGQRVITKVRYGESRKETSSDAAARVEGRNKALDYLLSDFIKDVLDTNQQNYRVSDAVLGPFDGGAHLPGTQYPGWRDWSLGSTCRIVFDGKDVTVELRSLREALDFMNGELGPVSFDDVNSALGKQDRYHGARFKVHVRDHGYSVPLEVDFAEFAFASGATATRLGFMAAGASSNVLAPSNDSRHVNVAYVISKGALLYVHPNLLGGLRERPSC